MSETKEEVVIHFLKALPFEHAKGVNFVNSMTEVLDLMKNWSSQQIACLTFHWMILMVTWQHGEKINEAFEDKKMRLLMAYIHCNLHIVHNSFRKGLSCYGTSIWPTSFTSSPWMHEEFLELQEDTTPGDNLFIWLVQTRWSSLLSALERIKKIWTVLKIYSLRFPP